MGVDIDTPLTATISFDYEITPGVDETNLFVQIPTADGPPLKSWDVHFAKDGTFSETVSLPAGTYPLKIEGSFECGVDCSDVLPLYEGAFTVIAVPYGDTFVMITSGPEQTVNDNGDVTLTLGYDLRPDVEQTGASALLESYVDDEAGNRTWFHPPSGSQWTNVDGPGIFTDTITLAPGTYTRHITSSFVQHCDCFGTKDIIEPYTFTVPEKVDPTPTPTPTVTPTPEPTATPTATPTPQPTDAPSPSPTATSTPIAISLSPSTVVRGNQVTVNAAGLAPGESVEIWLHSTPVKLLSTAASAEGTISKTVTIPSATTVGAHNVEVRGATSGSAYAALTVSDGLAITGFDNTSTAATGVGASILILGGIAALIIARRTHRQQV
ncbi:MAG: hypothetical protein PIR02_12555 [Microbacterium enclense]